MCSQTANNWNMLKCWLQTVIKAETYFKSVKRRNDSASQKPAEESNEFRRCLAASVFPKRRVCWETSASVSVNNRCCFLQTQGLVPRLPNEKAAPSTIRRRNRPVLSLTHQTTYSCNFKIWSQSRKASRISSPKNENTLQSFSTRTTLFLPRNTKGDVLNNVLVIFFYAITTN